MSNRAETIETAKVWADAAVCKSDLVARLFSISKSTRALSGLLLKEIALVVGQDQLLNALHHETPISVSAVSIALNVRPSTISKMTDRLVLKGLIERGFKSGDARISELRLTHSGVIKRNEVHHVWVRLEEEICLASKVITEGEMAATLNAIDDILRKRLSRLR